MKRFYNVNSVSYYDKENNQWLHGYDAIKYMRCIKSDGGNWDLYLDEQSGCIYYVAVVPGCNSGPWGTMKHFKKRYGHDFLKQG